MAVHNYTNTASVAVLDAPLNSSGPTFSVSNFTGHPAAPFFVLIDRDTSSAELMEVTGVAGTTLTVLRGVGGTASTSHAAGALIEHVIPASVPQAAEAHIEATSGVHGVAGALLGSDSAGTLTNKTFSGAFVHTYSAGLPVAPEAGYVVNGDNSIARDGFVFDGDGANADRRGFLLSQNGIDRVEVFNDGTVKVTPSPGSTRSGIESMTTIRTADLDVTDDAVVAGDLSVAGTATVGITSTGNLSVSGTATVGGQTTLGALTAGGAAVFNGAGNGLVVANTASVGALGVVSGDVSLAGTNARLGLPPAPTASTPGTATGQIRYRAGRVEAWNGTTWRCPGGLVRADTYAGGGNDGVYNAEATLFTQGVSDPGFPYKIGAAGQFEFNFVADGTRWDLVTCLDSPSNPTYFTQGLGNGFTQTGYGWTPELTGAHTVYWVARRIFGPSTVTVTAFSQFMTLTVIGT